MGNWYNKVKTHFKYTNIVGRHTNLMERNRKAESLGSKVIIEIPMF